MHTPENGNEKLSRKAQLELQIKELRNTKIVNQSDPKYAAEIQEQIERFEEELAELQN